MDVLLVDTVGFIRKLPHQLVDAFQSTLEEVSVADAIIQVIDSADPDAAAQMAVVEQLLTKLEAAGKPRLFVFNKTDSLVSGPELADPDQIDQEPAGLAPELMSFLPTGQRQQAFLVSARTGDGIEELIEAISELAARGQIVASLLIPYPKAGLLDYIRHHGHLDHVEYLAEGISLKVHIKCSHFNPLRPFVQLAESSEKG